MRISSGEKDIDVPDRSMFLAYIYNRKHTQSVSARARWCRKEPRVFLPLKQCSCAPCSVRKIGNPIFRQEHRMVVSIIEETDNSEFAEHGGK